LPCVSLATTSIWFGPSSSGTVAWKFPFWSTSAICVLSFTVTLTTAPTMVLPVTWMLEVLTALSSWGLVTVRNSAAGVAVDVDGAGVAANIGVGAGVAAAIDVDAGVDDGAGVACFPVQANAPSMSARTIKVISTITSLRMPPPLDRNCCLRVPIISLYLIGESLAPC